MKTAQEYFDEGVKKYKLKDYAGAVKDYTEAIRINPHYANAFTNRGYAKYKLKKYAEAMKDYTQAIRINPHDAKAYNNRGAAKRELQKYQEAIEDYTQAIRINDQYAIAYNNRGNAKKKLQNYAGAIEDYTQAIRINPQDAKAFYNRGNAKVGLQEYAGAIEDYAKAVDLCFVYDTEKLTVQKVCKFLPMNENTRGILNNKQIWFAHPSTFNDPLDGNFLQRYYEENKSLFSVLDTILIASFVGDTKRALENENLMWSHYAKDHTGICLVYEFKKPFRSKRFLAQAVDYLPEIEHPNMNNLHTTIESGFFTKQKCWEYEDEFRIVYRLQEAKTEKKGKAIPLSDLGLVLKEIVFGLKCTEMSKQLIKQIISGKEEYKEVRLYKMTDKKGGNHFQLEKKEVDRNTII
ncbi:MAG: tetratricopeptide repeat protein [Chitinophagaceae bacterium]|nr:tetratricopeptide repeat protein [Chitinophagaceae bacterium]